MPVTFTAARATLARIATDLSSEATASGLTQLSTNLTNLSTEISTTNSSITEKEFFGGSLSGTQSSVDYDSAALVWAAILQSAAKTIETKNLKTIADKQTTIADKQTTIADKQTIIADKQTIIADKQTIIADKQTLIETYQKRIKELGEGVGYRIKSPYDIFSMVTVWKLLIEEGKILDLDPESAGKETEALSKVLEYMQKIDTSIPKEF